MRTTLRLWLEVTRVLDRAVFHPASTLLYKYSPLASPSGRGLDLVENIQYLPTGRRDHRLDVIRPADDLVRPTVLYVHGGAFSVLSKDTHRVMAVSYASLGYVVFIVNYRLGPSFRFPAQLKDATAALDWVLEHAAEHGADPQRLVLAGESAGANLVTTLAYAATHPRHEAFARALYDRQPPIRAVVPTYGLYDMHDVPRLWRHKPYMPHWIREELLASVHAYIGWPLEERAVEAELASPLKLLAKPRPPGSRPMPPMLASCGTYDPLLNDSRRLRTVMQARRETCELHVYPGEIHGFDAMVWRPVYRRHWAAVGRFLERYV